jgi:hypothetical protein
MEIKLKYKSKYKKGDKVTFLLDKDFVYTWMMFKECKIFYGDGDISIDNLLK